VSYTLDNQYRLTQETISGEANPLLNGTSDWEYDLVGNRLSQLSDIDQILNASETYSDNNCSSPAHRAPARLTPSRCFGADAEHRPSTRGCASWLDSHDYDSNGNTIRSAQLQQASVTLHDTYDWRNRLITRQRSDGTIIEIVYDGFGDRMEKTVRNASFLILNSTKFLVDRNNLTGYAQVVEEIGQGGELQVIYTYGLDLISQDRRDDDLSGNFTQSYYLYDGLGSIRALTDSTGAITDTYTYDAWGVLINQTSSLTRPTSNAFRFTGEQWDEDLGMYFLRARYLNVSTGRFHTMDTFEGVTTDPVTLHKYLYANANPISYIDPSGNLSLGETAMVGAIVGILSKLAVVSYKGIIGGKNYTTGGILYELAEGAGYGALGGFIAFKFAPVISAIGGQTGLYGLFGTGTFTGTVSASAVAQFKELVDLFIFRKPTTFTDSAGRIVTAARGGFITGGLFTVFRYVKKAEPSSPKTIEFRPGTREVQVITPYNNLGPGYYSGVNDAAALGAAPGNIIKSVIERIIRAGISDDEYYQE
jgi:RHS repeat-associated protein